MVDLAMLESVELSSRPFGQRFVANVMLWPNYDVLGKVDIVLEGLENLPERGPVIIAMNHTDRFNYWPFQYKLSRVTGRYTATWVKAKYYEHPMMRRFMLGTNNLPTVSRGYLITKDFLSTLGRVPETPEYVLLRRMVEDPSIDPEGAIPEALLTRPRDVLGLRFDPSQEGWAVFMRRLYREMMIRFVALNRQALSKDVPLIIFPQGTRSKRLSKGHIGLSEIALALGATIVPVGCNGSDQCYPGSSPWAQDGRIVYRIGEPIAHEQMAAFHIPEPFVPFTPEAEARWRPQFEGYIGVVMDRINDLLDEPYRYSDDLSSDGVKGAGRFI